MNHSWRGHRGSGQCRKMERVIPRSDCRASSDEMDELRSWRSLHRMLILPVTLLHEEPA